jgi:AP endonuclease-1
MVHWQTRKSSSLSSEINTEADTEISDDSIPKRFDSLWKVGARASAAGGIENTVTNAVSIGSVIHKWSCYQPSTRLLFFISANSFAFFLKSPFQWESPSLTPHSISEFKKRMEQYGYANNMALPNSNYLIHLGNPDRFVSDPV